jgi:hypothetical protein
MIVETCVRLCIFGIRSCIIPKETFTSTQGTQDDESTMVWHAISLQGCVRHGTSCPHLIYTTYAMYKLRRRRWPFYLKQNHSLGNGHVAASTGLSQGKRTCHRVHGINPKIQKQVHTPRWWTMKYSIQFRLYWVSDGYSPVSLYMVCSIFANGSISFVCMCVASECNSLFPVEQNHDCKGRKQWTYERWQLHTILFCFCLNAVVTNSISILYANRSVVIAVTFRCFYLRWFDFARRNEVSDTGNDPTDGMVFLKNRSNKMNKMARLDLPPATIFVEPVDQFQSSHTFIYQYHRPRPHTSFSNPIGYSSWTSFSYPHHIYIHTLQHRRTYHSIESHRSVTNKFRLLSLCVTSKDILTLWPSRRLPCSSAVNWNIHTVYW